MYEGNFLASRLAAAGSNDLKRNFITKIETGLFVEYLQFFHNSEKSAQVLSDLGVKAGHRVLVYAPKSVASLELYFGCLLCGAVYTPINPSLPTEDLEYFSDDCNPALIICDELRATAARKLPSIGAPILTINANETGTFISQRETRAAGFKSIARTAHDAAAILYTSGTTGRPKGVVHTHNSLWSNAETLVKEWRFNERDILIHALPIFHLHGLFTAMNVLLTSGASCFYISKFDPERVLDVMPKSTVFMGVPPYYMSLLKNSRLMDAAENMRVFISGSAPMLPQTHKDWKRVTGSMILERYGMTECSMIASNPYFKERRINSVGFPLEKVEIRVVDLIAKTPVLKGSIGMIEIKGPNLFEGYYNKPEKTAEDMTEDGYFISGDVGKFDEDGYLYVLGRVKDAIFSEEGIILPKEIEEWLDMQDGIQESAVIGVEHPQKGPLPVAIIATENQTVNVEMLQAHVTSKFPPYKRPQLYVRVENLPRNTMGKVQKAALRLTYADLFMKEHALT